MDLTVVLTVNDEKYKQPTPYEGGLLVVNKSVIPGAPANKLYFYNKNNGTYYHINEQTASEDRLKQVADYEQRLNNIGQMNADTTNPTQVNSFADLASMLLTGDLKSFYYGVPNYLHNMVVRPMFDKDLKGQRASTLVNNFLVNLGETVDYFTLTNLTKGYALGGNVKDAYFWSRNTGRTQYDWNTGDRAADLFLEIVSDPTNWISLGSKRLLMDAFKSSVDDVGARLGLTVNQDYLKKVSKKVYDGLDTSAAFRDVSYTKLFNLTDADDVAVVDKTLRASLEAKRATKDVNLIRTVMGSADYFEKNAFKTATLTSALGLEATAVLDAVKMGRKHLNTYLNSKLNNMLRYNSNITSIANYTELKKKADELEETLKELTSTYDVASEGLSDTATRTIRVNAVKDLNNIVHPAVRNVDEVVKGLQEWAVKNEYKNINEAYIHINRLVKEGASELKELRNMLFEAIEGTVKELDMRRLKMLRSAIDTFKNEEDSLIFRTYNPKGTYYEEDPIIALRTSKDTFNKLFERLNEYADSAENKALLEQSAVRILYGRVADVIQYMAHSMLARTELLVPMEFVKGMQEYWHTLISMLQELNIKLPEQLLAILEDMRTAYKAIEVDGHNYNVRALLGSVNIRLNEFYNNYLMSAEVLERVEEMHKVLDIELEEVSKRAVRYRTNIDLSHYKATQDKYNGKNIFSRALKDSLGKDFNKVNIDGHTVSDAFIHVDDLKNESANDLITLNIKDMLGEFTYSDRFEQPHTIKTINGMKVMLYDMINKYDFHEEDELRNLIDHILGDPSHRARTVKLSESEVKELSEALRYRANELRKVLEDAKDEPMFSTTVLKKIKVDETEVTDTVREFFKKLYNNIPNKTYLIRRFGSIERFIDEYHNKHIPFIGALPKEEHEAMTSLVKALYATTVPVSVREWDESIADWKQVTHHVPMEKAIQYGSLKKDPSTSKWFKYDYWTYASPDLEKSKNTKILLDHKYAVMETDAYTLESIADNLYSYIEEAYKDAGKVNVSLEQISSSWYVAKQAQADALQEALSTDSVVNMFENILNGTREGAILRVLENDTDDSVAFAAQFLHATAVSAKAYGDFLKELRTRGKNSPITEEWASAINDALAGIAHDRRYKYLDTDKLTNKLLQDAKEYINKSNNTAHDVRLVKSRRLEKTDVNGNAYYSTELITRSVLPEGQAEQIQDILYNSDSAYHKLVASVLEEPDKYNVVFSIGQVSKAQGVFELVCKLPDEIPGYGREVHILNTTPHYYANYWNELYAKDILGSEHYRQKLFVHDNKVYQVERPHLAIFDEKNRRTEYAPDAIHCATEDEFAIEVSRFLEALKAHVNPIDEKTKQIDTSKTIRFIGFGNSYEYNKQDTVLNNFFTNNHINFKLDSGMGSLYSAETLDIKALIQANQGSVVITDELHRAVHHIVKKQKRYLDTCNEGLSVRAGLIPDFSVDLIDSLNTINSNVRKALTDPETSESVLAEYSEKTLSDLSSNFKIFTDDIVVALRTVRETNKVLGQEIILADIFNKLSGNPNIMNFLKKNIVGKNSGVSAKAIKKLNDPKLMSEWYKLDNLAGVTQYAVISMNKLVQRLQTTVENITTPYLLYDESILKIESEVLEGLEKIIRERCKINTSSVMFLRDVASMKSGLTPEQTYAIALQCMYHINKLGENVRNLELKQLIEKSSDKEAMRYYLGWLEKPWDSVMNSHGLYIPQIQNMKPVEFDKSYDVYEALETRRIVNNLEEVVSCLNDSLRLIDETLDERHMNTDNIFKIKRPVYDTYIKLIDTIKGVIDFAQNEFEYCVSNAKNILEQHGHKLMYTRRLEMITNALKDISTYHAFNRMHNILGMDAVEYERYLYKYSQGIQVYDLNSTLLKDESFARLLSDRIRFINSEANGTSLRTAQQGEFLIIYINKDVDKGYLEELHKTMRGSEDANGVYTPGIVMHFEDVSLEKLPAGLAARLEDNEFFEQYLNYVQTMEHTHDLAYSVSMQRAMNDKRYKELLNFLSDDIKNNLLDMGYWESYGLLQSGLTHTMVGDYASGLGSVFKTYSSNLITNVNSGFSKMYRQNVSKEAYITLFTSPSYALKNSIDAFNGYFKSSVTPEELYSAIEENGYKVASFDGKSLNTYDVSTSEGLQVALNHNAILIDADVYDKVFRAIVSNDLPKWMTNNAVYKYMFLLKIGQLLSPGWVVRNIIDSTVKGAVASNANLVEYVSMIPAVTKKLKEFDKVLSEVNTKYESPTAYNIRKYYGEHAEEAKQYGITLEEALDYYKFSKNSASVPTPAQLSILNNVSEKIEQLLSSYDHIKKNHVDALLKAYVDYNGDYILVKQKLLEIFPKDVVTDLLTAFNQIPTGYAKMKDTNMFTKLANKLTNDNFLMHWNNNIERVERFLAYDYNRIMGKTTGASIDVVNKSQFNRSYDTIRRRVLDMVLPFSSFTVDNTLFWLDSLSKAKGSLLGVLTDYLQTQYDEEELSVEEIATNLSVQYMFLQGNIMVDEDGYLTIKTSDSLFNTMNILADPVKYLKNAFNVPTEKLVEFIKAWNQDEEEYLADPYGKVKPLSMWDDEELFSLHARDDLSVNVPYAGAIEFSMELIPVLGAWWLREKTALTDPVVEPLSIALRVLVPSLFGRVKRTGYDWYGVNNNEEYHKTHTFVPGISYVPKWMESDNPQTYVNTIERLVALGYDRDTAVTMVVDWGYYMKAPDYVLKQFKTYRNTYIPKRSPVKRIYPKKIYTPKPKYVKKMYPKKVYPKTVKSLTGGDRYRTTRFGVARIYRLTSMYDRITKSGTSRMTMMLSRGHGASSIRVVRDRIKNNNIKRQRQRRILRM